jgi:RNA polymerase sigma-70 factor (ECF subfamily)
VNLATVTALDAWRTDESLVAAACAGDRDAKAMLFRRYARLASDLAYRLLGRDGELEDVVQESFVAAFASLPKLADPRAFKAWLTAIVTRTTIATLRRRRLLARLGFVHVEQVQVENVLAPNAPPDVLVELRAVYRSLDSLPAKERVVLVLRRVERLPLEEIARRTGFSLATVKRQLTRAEERLRVHGEKKGERA